MCWMYKCWCKGNLFFLVTNHSISLCMTKQTMHWHWVTSRTIWVAKPLWPLDFFFKKKNYGKHSSFLTSRNFLDFFFSSHLLVLLLLTKAVDSSLKERNNCLYAHGTAMSTTAWLYFMMGNNNDILNFDRNILSATELYRIYIIECALTQMIGYVA